MPDLPIRVVIIDSCILFRAGIRLILEKEPGINVVGEAEDSAQGILTVAQQKPDINLVNLSQGANQNLEFIPQLLKAWNSGRIILILDTEDLDFKVECIDKGALGIVSLRENPEILVKAIEKVYAGEIWIRNEIVARVLAHNSYIFRRDKKDLNNVTHLSKREFEITELVCRGYKNSQIALQLNLSESTIRHHLTSIYNKVGVSNRVELLVQSTKNGLETYIK
jgi:DNA-binding NarL/FixJ family response regulator